MKQRLILYLIFSVSISLFAQTEQPIKTWTLAKSSDRDNASLLFTPSGFLIVGDGKDVRMLNTQSSKDVWLRGHGKDVHLLALNQGGRQLLSASTDTTLLQSNIENPQYEGGIEALHKYFDLNYPTAARLEGIEGKVLVSFTVEKDGQISDIKIKESQYFKSMVSPFSIKIIRVPQYEKQEPALYRSMNRQTIKVVKEMPKWKAGKQYGIPVRMHYSLSIVYKLI